MLGGTWYILGFLYILPLGSSISTVLRIEYWLFLTLQKHLSQYLRVKNKIRESMRFIPPSAKAGRQTPQFIPLGDMFRLI